VQDNGDCSSNLRIDLAWNATLLFGNKVSCIPKETSIAQAAATIVEIPYVIDNDPNSESLPAPIAPTKNAAPMRAYCTPNVELIRSGFDAAMSLMIA
jgi:hypothetical protein